MHESIRGRDSLLILSIVTLLSGCIATSSSRDSSRTARVELLALIQTLNADLLSHDSATLTLERWCSEHHLAMPARVVAQRQRDATKPLPDEMRTQLAISPSEPVGYRRVQLSCGSHVLSEADNWYVPSRLTAEMNRQLETTDTPFGKVVKSLDFERRTLAVDLLWSPLPSGWEMERLPSDTKPLHIPHDVLRHRAILYSGHRPFSALVETYTSALFDFGDWTRQ